MLKLGVQVVSSVDAQRREREVRKPSCRGPEVRFEKTEERTAIQVGVGEAGWLSVGPTQSVWR